MAKKVYPFKIKPTDILIQNEGGGGMLMNDQFVSIVGNVIPDQQKLLDDQIDVNDVNVQTNAFSSGIFITNVESNPLPIEDLASKNFDSLDENVTESEVVVAQPNEPDNLQLPIIVASVLPSPSPTPTPSPSPSPLTPEEIEEGIYIANFLPADEEEYFQAFATEDIDLEIDTEIVPDKTVYSKDETSVEINVSYNNIIISKNGSTPDNFLPRNSSRDVAPYYSFVAAAKASIGTFTKGIPGISSTSPKGVYQPAGKGCGVGVSIIYMRATGHGINYKSKPPKPGKEINFEYGTTGIYNLISKDTINWRKRDNWKNAQPGDIIVTTTKEKSGHIGFVIDTKKKNSYIIVSNSSGKGEISDYFTINTWSTVANRPGVGSTYAFQFIGKFTDPGKTI